MENAAAAATGLPPLSLSSGPAISGGPTTGGPASTGNFTYYGKPSWSQELTRALPIIVLGVAVIWMIRKK